MIHCTKAKFLTAKAIYCHIIKIFKDSLPYLTRKGVFLSHQKVSNKYSIFLLHLPLKRVIICIEHKFFMHWNLVNTCLLPRF
jgi:hypothetical protein